MPESLFGAGDCISKLRNFCNLSNRTAISAIGLQSPQSDCNLCNQTAISAIRKKHLPTCLSPCAVGCDDFKETFPDAQICWLVTKTNSWVPMGNLEVASYTRQEHHLGDRIFSTRQKSVFFLFSSFSVQMKVRYMIKPSSVTKRNIMDGIDKAFGIVNTPHQWRYCDRICSLGSGIYFIDNLNTVDLRLDKLLMSNNQTSQTADLRLVKLCILHLWVERLN